jgi:hypothetical protein
MKPFPRRSHPNGRADECLTYPPSYHSSLQVINKLQEVVNACATLRSATPALPPAIAGMARAARQAGGVPRLKVLGGICRPLVAPPGTLSLVHPPAQSHLSLVCDARCRGKKLYWSVACRWWPQSVKLGANSDKCSCHCMNVKGLCNVGRA